MDEADHPPAEGVGDFFFETVSTLVDYDQLGVGTDQAGKRLVVPGGDNEAVSAAGDDQRRAPDAGQSMPKLRVVQIGLPPIAGHRLLGNRQLEEVVVAES
jgi:hypothetical protein